MDDIAVRAFTFTNGNRILESMSVRLFLNMGEAPKFDEFRSRQHNRSL